MSDGETPSREEVQAHSLRVLQRGSEGGQAVLNRLAEEKLSSSEAIASIAWAAAWITHSAPDEDTGHKIMEALMRSMCIYTTFFEDTDDDHQASGAQH
jgi:hypothetical protein